MLRLLKQRRQPAFILLLAQEDHNLNENMLLIKFRTTKRGHGAGYFYHFPELMVKEGERIALFAAEGKNMKKTENGTVIHCLFFGKRGFHWNKDDINKANVIIARLDGNNLIMLPTGHSASYPVHSDIVQNG
ncbi:hypothetical protein [Chitinophaga sp. CB10]|uniref:hypothetical protein n=1 Tax=Chitinophaga sp. CB10 TaxID=1891659 RepID=UPI0025C5C422|nr:hypothetical protein [Chitinophaga sp. CB10]